MPAFIPGLQLSEMFYREAVKPILDSDFPGLQHSACRLGYGSEVLGFDTEMSRDHDWGPRVDLFLSEADFEVYRDAVDDALQRRLPSSIHGYSTHFGEHVEPTGQITQVVGESSDGRIRHLVSFTTPARFFRGYLGWEIESPLAPADWLTFPAQHLLTIASGRVYHDDLGVQALREKLAWYPHDVWLYLLAAGWTRLGEEEHLMPRTGYVGDELGSALIGSCLVRDMMRLCFLMERRYAPYAKWFGTGFMRLNCAAELAPLLWQAQIAETWQQREAALVPCYEALARMHNALNLTPPLHTEVRYFFSRPFKVMVGGIFSNALVEQIADPVVKAIAERTMVGGIDFLTDNTDGFSPVVREALRTLYT
ncbi:MAG: DUF4037 domain-containing protein [bacterium]|nr:DUF4037 domain-containing protein [bacterium]